MNYNKIGHHISELFNKELNDICDKVLTMGGLVEQQLEHAMLAYTTCDLELADIVIKQDAQINALEMAIDSECSQIIATRQPTAIDLRLLIAVIKIVRELERAGDKAERIAQMGIKLCDLETVGLFNHQHELEHMAHIIMEMLHRSLDAFARIEIDDIANITARDAHVNREYENVLRQLITRMMEDPRNITRALDVIWVARALERVGDYACNICEHVVYVVKGEDVRHLSQQQLEEKVRQQQP